MRRLGCDYYGSSLHKWTSGPLGSGLLYIRKERIRETWPLFACADPQMEGRIEKFRWIGTHPPVASAVLPALDLLEAIGIERKQARHHYLKRYWAEQLSGVPRVQIHTNLLPEHSCGVACVGIEGIEGDKLSKHLLEEHRILTYSAHAGGLQGLQVTTQVYTRLSDLDAFVSAIKSIARNGIPA